MGAQFDDDGWSELVSRHINETLVEAYASTEAAAGEPLTYEKMLSIHKKLEVDRKRFEVTLGEHTFNLLDYQERAVEFPEGGILLTDTSRTEMEKALDPRPTDLILLDMKAGLVFFLGFRS
ncbi:MAG TPA: hypothetical protein VGC91_07990 [Pyrinomonadaceae bacterium]|jgi:hypothetical protein